MKLVQVYAVGLNITIKKVTYGVEVFSRLKLMKNKN